VSDDQADPVKKSATFYSGTTLHSIHVDLAAASPPLALPNVGSISDQTIGGLISTASHGSGVNFPVLSQHVLSLTLVLPLPGAPIVRASPTEDVELFKASLCGLGATGLMLEVEIEVEEAFRLRETKEGKGVDHVLDNLDEIKQSAEHVRLWWYPDGQGVVIGRANRTYEVCHLDRNDTDHSPLNPNLHFWRTSWDTMSLSSSSSSPDM
jgi:FAD/FMN-containing dehydrogenase